MTSLVFIADDSIQSTTTTISGSSTYIPVYAYNTNLSSLSTYSYLSINNLNATSTTTFNNLNSLSTNSILNINNLNATSTTIFNNLNSLSTNSILSINGHTTQISNLNATSTTIFNNLNSLSTNSILSINGHTTQISNLNNTSTTIFNNMNSLSTNSTLSINSHTTQISNLNATSTTIFNNLNSLSTNSIFYINNLNTTSTTVFNNLNSLSTNSIFSINNINNTSTTIFNNLNSLSTNSILNINNLNATSTSIFNKTNFTNLLVSNASTINSSLNVVGYIIGSGTALTNLNYNSILNPPSLVSFNNPSTFISTLNISGNTTLNNATTCLSSLNVVGNIIGSGTALTNLNYGSITNPPDLTLYNGWTKITGTNNIYNTGSYGKVGINTTTPQGALEIVGYNNTYRIKFGTTLSTGSPLGANRIYSNGLFRFLSTYYTDEIATFHRIDNYDDPINAIEYFSIKTSGVNVTANLNISGTTTLNNNTTCMATLNVSGVTTLSNSVTLKGELVNQYWKFTNDSDYCRLNGVGGGYFNFAAQDLYSSGIVNANGTIYANGDKLNFTNSLNQYKINLWGTNNYGFGIANDTLQYSSNNFHKFFNSTNNLNTFSIDGTGNISLGSTYQLLISPPTSTNSSTFQTIQQGVGYSQNFALQATGGTVTIGTVTPNSGYKLSIYGSTYLNGGLVTTGDIITSAPVSLTGGNLSINKDNPIFTFSGKEENQTVTMFFGTPFQNTGAYKTAIIAEGKTGWSRNYLHFCLNNNGADNSRPAQNAGLNNIRFTIRPDGNYNFYPDPFYINNTTGANYTMNLNVACNTTATPAITPFITCSVADGFNGINTITTITGGSGAYDQYWNGSRIILDGSMATNSGSGNLASSISFQSQTTGGGWKSNVKFKTTSGGSINVGIDNTSPWAPLNVGDCSSTTDGFINFGKNSGGNRNCKVGYNSGFTFCIGDFGNVNNNSNNWSQQFGISYLAPQASLGIDSTGRVIMPNGYGNSSDERIKTNIKTIENALDKTLLLRGVEYNDFRIDPDKKHIGLIAQEVELIIPEVVGEGEMDKIKYISYGPLVGLLIEAIKQLNNKVNNLENILKNNNLN